ncbi:MAG TPA: hypothetical protein VN843_33635, partial [Anaerolineales bacterium]|nr:hypothetical protein [Anaerolineales bacterium]
ASPVVIKIDGGLDGISSVQAVRSAFSNDHSPIITSYPLLRRQLADKIANNLLIDALVLSGVDVIYIGSRPSLPSTSRELDAEKEENLRSSVLRYHRYVKENHSMPTVAGGINVAQLHSFYELLGPNVAFFLGGAISLQKKGPIEGASLCVRVIKNAAEVRQKIGHRPKYANLDSKLIKECENAYMNNYPYVSPQQLFSKFTGLPGWFTTDRK